MTAADRRPHRSASPLRARVLRTLRTSRAAPAARRVAARGTAVARTVGAPDGRVRAIADRVGLALRATRTRGAARAGLAALTTTTTGGAGDGSSVPPGSRATISIVLLVDGDTAAHWRGAGDTPLEVVAVLHGRGAVAPEAATTILPAVGGESLAQAAARGARRARGDRILFALASSECLHASVLADLRRALDDGAVVAGAQLVHPVRARTHATPYDGRVRQLGVELRVDDDVPVLFARAAGARPDPTAPPAPVAGVSAACLLVDRAAYAGAGGIPDYPDIDVAVFELGRRVRARGGRVVVVPHALVLDHRPVGSARRLIRPVAPTDAAWRQLVDDAGAALMREAAPLTDHRLRIAITVAAPSRKVAPRWGDWHLARDFAAALRRAGHLVRVQTADAADDPAGRACDVHCVIRGLAPVRRTRGQHHVEWIISHPETITDTELDAADLVFVASTRFAEELRARTTTPVEPLLQATEPARFRAFPIDAEHRHDVTVVAKSRDQFRTAVADAIATGLRPAIYGSGWERFVDPALVVAQYVDNDELARVYSSAGVVLNDHWESMRAAGFVSNRIFDALACGTPVISDDLPEVTELFEGAVPTFRDAAELRGLVDEILTDPETARARARAGRDIVLVRHTFDRRAGEFLDALARHGLDVPPAG